MTEDESASGGKAARASGDGPARRSGAARRGARARRLSLLFRVLLGTAIVASGFGVMMTLSSLRKPIEMTNLAARALTVRSMTVDRVTVAREWQGYGTARAMIAADVSAEVTGRVVERPEGIEDGVSVSEGQLLVRLESLDYERRVRTQQEAIASTQADLSGLEVEEARLNEQVELARAEVDTARRDYERTLDAQREGAASRGEIDSRERALRGAERSLAVLAQGLELVPSRRARLRATLEGQRAELEIAQRNLERTRIVSPIGGVVQRIGPEEGEWLNTGTAVARVVDVSRLEVPLRVPVSARRSIEPGDVVRLREDGTSAGRWQGVVTRVAPEADEASRTMTVFVEVRQESGDGVLQPGQFVTGRVRSGVGTERVVVPRRAVVEDRVWVALPLQAGDDGANGSSDRRRVRQVPVRVEYHISGRFQGLDGVETEWAVLEEGFGLSDGALVVLTNLGQLRAEMLVEVQDAGEPAAAPGGGP